MTKHYDLFPPLYGRRDDDPDLESQALSLDFMHPPGVAALLGNSFSSSVHTGRRGDGESGVSDVLRSLDGAAERALRKGAGAEMERSKSLFSLFIRRCKLWVVFGRWPRNLTKIWKIDNWKRIYINTAYHIIPRLLSNGLLLQ